MCNYMFRSPKGDSNVLFVLISNKKCQLQFSDYPSDSISIHAQTTFVSPSNLLS